MSKTEENKLIAEFMGWVHHEDPAYDEHEMSNLKYHTSWDWLMPVVIKICKLRFPDAKPEDEDYDDTSYLRTFGALTEEGRFMVRFNRHDLFEAEELIEATYEAVIDFITIYNSKH